MSYVQAGKDSQAGFRVGWRLLVEAVGGVKRWKLGGEEAGRWEVEGHP